MKRRHVYIGDLSLQDAEIVVEYAGTARRVLEFGVGGSTQLFAQYASPGVELISIDTSSKWIEATSERLSELGLAGRVSFHPWDYISELSGSFDVIFDDGLARRRAEFATLVWPLLSEGGVLVTHDTRRLPDIAWLSAFICEQWLTISSVDINRDDSNMTIITKGARRKHSSWNRGPDYEGWHNTGRGRPDDWVTVLQTEVEENKNV